jgi:hypothetical protein
MHRRVALALIGAAALASSSASMVRAGVVFTENFNSGDVTDGGIFSTGAITNPANVSFTEPVGGPLTVGISPAASGAIEGAYVQSTSLNIFDFTKGPVLITLNAPVVNGVQTSLAPPNGGDTGIFAPNKSATYLGVNVAGANEGTYTGASRIDTGVDKAYIAINSFNAIQYSLEYFDPAANANAFINYTFNRATNEIAKPAPNIKVTSMFLYFDAADAANGNFWINAGATWLDTNTGISTTNYLEGTTQAFSNVGVVSNNHDPASGMLAYDDGNKANGFFGNLTPAQDQAIFSQFSSGVAGGFELQDGSGDTVPGNSVSFGQLSVVVPEPASLATLAIGAGLFLRRRRQA